MSEIKREWQLRGSPNFLGEKLEDAPDERTITRVWTGVRKASKPSSTNVPESKPQPILETPSSRAWAKIKKTDDLHVFDDFLLAFPNAPEAEACKKARAQLAKRKDAEAIIQARKDAFAALPRDGYDVSVFDAFIETHQGTDEAFEAARLRRECVNRFEAASPDEDTRKQWESEAAVQFLTGQLIPEARKAFLHEISLSGFSDELFERLKRSGADLSKAYSSGGGMYARKFAYSDLSPLANLKNLTFIDCSGTQVSDLAPLQTLTNLQTLNCTGTQVSDLAPLQNLTNLQTLYCTGTQVSDLSPLQTLTNLQTLDCSHTQVSDLTPLQTLTNLQRLGCGGTRVRDLAPHTDPHEPANAYLQHHAGQ